MELPMDVYIYHEETPNIASLQIANLTKIYNNLNISFPDISANSGDLIYLIANTGSGKTTFCEIIAKFIKYDTGEIFINNNNIDNINVFEYIHYISQFPEHNLIGPTWKDDLLLWGIENNDYEDLHDCPIWKLSFGQKKALAFTALIHNPRNIWVLDEPYAGLDYDLANKLDNIIKNFLKNGGIVIVTANSVGNAFIRSLRTGGTNK